MNAVAPAAGVVVFPFILFAVFFLLVVALVIWQFVLTTRRRDALRAWAQENGWSYQETDRTLHKQFPRVAPFGRGSSRMSRNILEGTIDGAPCVLHQYQYTVQSGKSSTTHRFVCAALQMPMAGRGLSIQREGLGHKIFDALGGEDIDFASDAFSRRFWVRCDDRRFAYDILHPEMQEWLMGQTGHWQWHGERLLHHEPGVLDPRRAAQRIEAMRGFLQRLPRHRLAEASKASVQVDGA